MLNKCSTPELPPWPSRRSSSDWLTELIPIALTKAEWENCPGRRGKDGGSKWPVTVQTKPSKPGGQTSQLVLDRGLSAPLPLICQQKTTTLTTASLVPNGHKESTWFFSPNYSFYSFFWKKVKLMLQNYVSISRCLWIHDYQHWNVTLGFSMGLSTHTREAKCIFKGKNDFETSCRISLET